MLILYMILISQVNRFPSHYRNSSHASQHWWQANEALVSSPPSGQERPPGIECILGTEKDKDMHESLLLRSLQFGGGRRMLSQSRILVFRQQNPFWLVWTEKNLIQDIRWFSSSPGRPGTQVWCHRTREACSMAWDCCNGVPRTLTP